MSGIGIRNLQLAFTVTLVILIPIFSLVSIRDGSVSDDVQLIESNCDTHYENRSEVQHLTSYGDVIDGYVVTYRYQGERYPIEI